jgi:hypothetical protein
MRALALEAQQKRKEPRAPKIARLPTHAKQPLGVLGGKQLPQGGQIARYGLTGYVRSAFYFGFATDPAVFSTTGSQSALAAPAARDTVIVAGL